MTAEALRAKMKIALTVAAEHELAITDDFDEFLDEKLPSWVPMTYGGATSCVVVDDGGEEPLVLDMGSGLRAFGQHVLASRGPQNPQNYNILMSHLHWDHIMGLPFFAPAYIPGNRLRLHGGHDNIREALERQQSEPCFPVYFENLGADFEFLQLPLNEPVRIGNATVEMMSQIHSGGSFGYRITVGDRVLVYATDSEHKLDDLEFMDAVTDFFTGAHTVIFDAMYSATDAMSVKDDWGHSSNMVGVELAQAAGVERLVLFHHEPIHDDQALARMLGETRRLEELTREDRAPLEIVSAFDGMELSL